MASLQRRCSRGCVCVVGWDIPRILEGRCRKLRCFGEAAAAVAGSGAGSDLDGSIAKRVCAAVGWWSSTRSDSVRLRSFACI